MPNLTLVKKIGMMQPAGGASNPVALKGSGWWSFAWWSGATEVLSNGGIALDSGGDPADSATSEEVQTVVDQSGNANDMVQTSAGLRATLEDETGVEVLDFLGSNESYNFTLDANFPWFHGDSTRSRFELWALVTSDRDVTDNTFFQYSDDDAAGDEQATLFLDQDGGSTWKVNFGNGGGSLTHNIGATWNDGNYHILKAYYDGSNIVCGWDAGETSAADAGASTAANAGRWGARTSGTQPFPGRVRAFFWVSGGNLTADERTTMASFLEGLKP